MYCLLIFSTIGTRGDIVEDLNNILQMIVLTFDAFGPAIYPDMWSQYKPVYEVLYCSVSVNYSDIHTGKEKVKAIFKKLYCIIVG